MTNVTCTRGHDNPNGRRYCGECGELLSTALPACSAGHPNPAGQKFCGECGERLGRGENDTDAAQLQPIDSLEEILQVELATTEVRPESHDLGRYSDQLAMTFVLRNRSGKEIRAFTGTVVFLDLFGREKLRMKLTVDTSVLPAHGTVTDDSWMLELSPFNDDHKRLRTHRLQDMEVMFIVEAVLFTEGTQIGDPNLL